MLKGIIRNQGKAYGLEIAKGAFDFVKKTVPQAVIKLAPAENIPFDDSFFDICICSGTLEHFVDISKGLKEIRRVLKKNGFLIVVVPNRNWIGKLYDWSGINYLHTVVRHTLPDQLIERELCLSQWINLLNQNNFSVEGWQPWNTSIRAPIFNLIIIKPSYVKPALCFHFIIKAAKTDS